MSQLTNLWSTDCIPATLDIPSYSINKAFPEHNTDTGTILIKLLKYSVDTLDRNLKFYVHNKKTLNRCELLHHE